MTPGGRATTFAVGVALVFLIGSAVGTAVVRDRVYGAPAPTDTLIYLKSGTAVRRVALSYSSVLSDVYWIRALQYYGGRRLEPGSRAKDYSQLYPLLDIVTTLDPPFRIAYRFGAIFLAEPQPGGAGRPDLAIALLKKGFAAEPDYWGYLQDIGFIYYWWVGDYREAATWFTKAAEVPGAPWWLRSLAGVTMTEGGDRAGSRLLWQSLLSSADNDWLRENARLRLAQLDALDAIDRLNGLVRAVSERSGKRVTSWDLLIRARLLRDAPRDPTGTPYVIDPATGQVSVSTESKLHPLPVGSRARPGSR